MYYKLLLTALCLLPFGAPWAQSAITYSGLPYKLAFHHDEGPGKLEIWEYVPDGQTVDDWQQMITIHRYDGPVTPDQMNRATAARADKTGLIYGLDKDLPSLCFVTGNSTIVEFNAWRYDTGPDGKTWANAIQQRVPREKQAVQQMSSENAPADMACKAIAAWPMQYPNRP